MLETIRRQAIMRISRRYKRAIGCILPFPKKIADILEVNREESRECYVLTSSDNLFEVLLHGCGYEVSLRLRHCVCRGWDLTGIPCSHAIKVINENHQQPENHVNRYYKTEVWIENYKNNIKPVNGEKFWEKTGKAPIGVPGFRKMPGRPKKNRIKAAHESPSNPKKVTRDGRIITCSNCKKVGHNRTTCKNETFVKQGPARKRGRPHKILDAEGSTVRPRKRITSRLQPSIPLSTPNQSQSSTVSHSCTAPQQSVSALSSNVPSGRGRGRRGRPPGRGQVRKKVTVPRGQGVYMCPFTDRVFECWGPKSREIGGGSQPT